MGPGIWAFYLYYLAGLFSAFEWVCSQFGWELEIFSEKSSHRPDRISNKLPFTIIIVTLISLSIPLLDTVIPAKYQDYSRDELVTFLMSKAEFSETYQNDSRFASLVDSDRSEVFYGEIHYPIRQPEEGVEDQLEYQFAILGPEISREAHLGTEQVISEIREGREVITLGCDAGFPDQILFLYIVEEDMIFQTERNFDEICPTT
jgi:hypothetical protein